MKIETGELIQIGSNVVIENNIATERRFNTWRTHCGQKILKTYTEESGGQLIVPLTKAQKTLPKQKKCGSVLREIMMHFNNGRPFRSYFPATSKSGFPGK